MKVFINDEELEDHHFDEIRIYYSVRTKTQEIRPLGSKEAFEYKFIPMNLNISLQLIKDDWGVILQAKEREM